MPQQDVIIGAREGYEALPGTQRAPGNIAHAPATLQLRAGTIVGSLESSLKGRYDRSGSVSEIQVFKASHDIPGDRARLEVQRFVKAVQVIGPKVRQTSGKGYLRWTEFDLRPLERDVQALCASQLRAAGLQDDGPRGSGKLRLAGEMRFEIHDAPGLASSDPSYFPLAMLTDFVMRIAIQPRGAGAATEAAEFRYQCYFELLQDPYPEGMRSSSFVPTITGQSAFVPFDTIGQTYARETEANKPKAPTMLTREEMKKALLEGRSLAPGKTGGSPSGGPGAKSGPAWKEWG
jgi:hypothetical protein